MEDTLFTARQRAVQLAQEQAQKQSSSGFWSSIFGSSDCGVEEYTLEDRQRVTQILQHCSDQLCTLFDVSGSLFVTLTSKKLEFSVCSSMAKTGLGKLCPADQIWP